MAASMGCMPIIRRLMDRAQHKAGLRTELLCWSQRVPQTRPFGKPVHQSIGEAVLGNHVDVVEYLLRQEGIEAHLQHCNSRSENVLHLASRLCNPAMFKLLVPRFKEGMHQTDDQKETVLVRIIKRSSASRDRYRSAEILLSEGAANGDGLPGDKQQDPLQIAVRLGDLNMCSLLICIGKMNPLSALRRDNDGQMILKEETSGNEQKKFAILQLLREHADGGSASSLGHHPGSKS
jgi:ankyrin repeat protein